MRGRVLVVLLALASLLAVISPSLDPAPSPAAPSPAAPSPAAPSPAAPSPYPLPGGERDQLGGTGGAGGGWGHHLRAAGERGGEGAVHQRRHPGGATPDPRRGAPRPRGDRGAPAAPPPPPRAPRVPAASPRPRRG